MIEPAAAFGVEHGLEPAVGVDHLREHLALGAGDLELEGDADVVDGRSDAVLDVVLAGVGGERYENRIERSPTTFSWVDSASSSIP